jgi:ABC-type nitrate/sulfonate/bicarbonate transport system permease component
MLASNRGLGALLIRSSQQFQMAGVFTAITSLIAMATS